MKTAAKTDKNMQEAIAHIAIEELRLDTLETRKSGEDFTEQAVWCIKEALTRAYNAGREAAKHRQKPRYHFTQGDFGLYSVLETDIISLVGSLAFRIRIKSGRHGHYLKYRLFLSHDLKITFNFNRNSLYNSHFDNNLTLDSEKSRTHFEIFLKILLTNFPVFATLSAVSTMSTMSTM